MGTQQWIKQIEIQNFDFYKWPSWTTAGWTWKALEMGMGMPVWGSLRECARQAILKFIEEGEKNRLFQCKALNFLFLDWSTCRSGLIRKKTKTKGRSFLDKYECACKKKCIKYTKYIISKLHFIFRKNEINCAWV